MKKSILIIEILFMALLVGCQDDDSPNLMIEKESIQAERCIRDSGNGDDISPARLQRIKDYIDGKISYSTIPVGDQWGTAYTEGNDNIDYYDVFYKDMTTGQEHNLHCHHSVLHH